MLDMTQKIFNSNNARIKCDLEFKQHYWMIRSSHNNFSIGGIHYSGIVGDDYTDSVISFLPVVCSI